MEAYNKISITAEIFKGLNKSKIFLVMYNNILENVNLET